MNADSTSPSDVMWFALSKEEALERLGSSESGLGQPEADARLKLYGPNVTAREKPKGPLYYFARQINQPIIFVLVASALITSYLSEWIDTTVIAAVILANSFIGFLQESKAEEAIAELTRYIVPNARVKREATPRTLNSEQVVPGDLVVLQAGDMIPADMRIVFARDLFIDESILTGESSPVSKSSDPLREDVHLPADQVNMAFSGTFIVRGRGEGLVVRTGASTEISRISQELRSTRKARFPMVDQIQGLTKVVSVLVVLGGIFTVLVGVLRGYALADVFRASVAIAVAAIPEGLPALVTVALAIGVRSMARRNAIVRTLPAVEALGSTTVICSDKTGTLTLNRMRVLSVFAGGTVYESRPPLYECVEYCDHEGPVAKERDPVLFSTLTAGVLCNDGSLVEGRPEGDPTEVALLVAGESVGLRPTLIRLDEIPFETSHGYMATLHEREDHNIIFVKGAPEKVLPRCSWMMTEDKIVKLNRETVLEETKRMAGQALRVLAIAEKEVRSDRTAIAPEDIKGLVLLGLVGMLDPPRPEAKKAIQACHLAGIRVIMVTGDHRETALAIAQQIGLLEDRQRIVTGEELELMSDRDFEASIFEADIFARTTPEQKLRIVQRLVGKGEIVAVTGDGVNDAPSLKGASIGVAMGSGTEVAKAASDIVLKDDNFTSIVAAIEEGRDVYSKVKRIMAWTLPTNIAEAMLLVLALAIGVSLPLLPLQILWVNLVTAVALAIPLAFEPREEGLLLRRPRPRNEGLIDRLVLLKFAIAAPIMIAGTYAVFALYQQTDHGLDLARTVAVNTLVLFEIAFLFNSRSLTAPALSARIGSNIWLPVGAVGCLLAQLAMTYVGPLSSAFGTTRMGIIDWVVAVAVASTVFVAIEIQKMVSRSRRASSSPP